ncbi:hypothetical protein MSPP1_000131 [Malassezia sp. CBS 17886]|nr:hypothetical protein MSPP1_000131 [Malassezia sp. CBS 17886]
MDDTQGSAASGSRSAADPAPPEGRMSVGEQRKLRREYRTLLAAAQTTRRNLPESSIQDVGKMVELGDELYEKVKAPVDGLLDSRFLLSMSDMGAEITRTMRLESNAFDMDDFLYRIACCVGGELHAPQRERRRSDADGVVETEPAIASLARAEGWDWARLGSIAAQHSRRAPAPEFLLGPLQMTPKTRRGVRRLRLDDIAAQQAPEQLELGDIARSENETARMVLEIADRLEEAAGEDGICLFRFALNPESFSNSVENLFYISFLIRDGKAAILEDDEGDPLLLRSEEPTDEDRAGGLVRRQIVMELDMHTWKELLALYDVTEPLIPTRPDPPATTGTSWRG